MNNIDTFEHLERVWIQDLKQSLPNVDIVLIGNKTDKDSSFRQVSIEQSKALCEKHNLSHYMEVSALMNTGVKELVEHLSERLLQKHDAELNEYKDSDGGGSLSDMTPLASRST